MDEQLCKEILLPFCNLVLDKVTPEFYKSASCSAWDTKRSAYTQLGQLYLVDNTLSDEEIMKAIFPFTAPCYSGSCIPCGKVWIPENFSFIVSRNALNGWAPQNHMDCAAAAAAGAANAALGISRGSPGFISVHDIVTVMKLYTQANISSIINDYEQGNPKIDLSSLKKAILNNLHSEEQEDTGEDNRERSVSRNLLNQSIKQECDKAGKNALSYTHLLSELYYLKSMRMVECRAGFVHLPDALNATGLPLTARIHEDYSWEELKKWVAEPNTAVIAYIPRHAVLVFATGETADGKYRHTLIGRASGGQTPSTWIPFTETDVHPDEDFWFPGGTLGSQNQSGLKPLMHTCITAGRSSYWACVVKRTEPILFNTNTSLANFTPPPYLQSRELVCDSCALHKGQNDSASHPTQRRKWLSSS